MTEKQLRGAERTLSAGTWAITCGAILFSALTVTPLVQRVTPEGWGWTAPVLPVVVDAAVVIVIRLDATVARLGGHAGAWPAILRWLTGLMTIALNIGDSALSRDLVGVGVHLVAPVLLIATGEAGLAYRRAITAALARIEREQREAADRERAERERSQEQQRERERQQQQAREQSEAAQREHEARLHREQAEREERERQAARDHELALERERTDREAAERKEARTEREEREARERAEREQVQRQKSDAAQLAAREREDRQRVERQERAERREREQQQGPAVNTVQAERVNTVKLPEVEALQHVREHHAQRSVRQLASETGWSLGWVAARSKEFQPVAA